MLKNVASLNISDGEQKTKFSSPHKLRTSNYTEEIPNPYSIENTFCYRKAQKKVYL
jgi:hypothetical protein